MCITDIDRSYVLGVISLTILNEVRVSVFFNRDDYLVATDKDIEFLNTVYGISEKHIYYTDNNDVCDTNISIGIFDNKLSTLVHECSHATTYLMEYFETENNDNKDEVDEARAYMLEELFSAISSQMIVTNINRIKELNV